MIFPAFKKDLTKLEEKDFIAWINDIYKHLDLLIYIEDEIFDVFKSIESLLNIGIIDDEKEYEDFIKWLKKYKEVDGDRFLTQISKISHKDETKCVIDKFCLTCRSVSLKTEMDSAKPTLVDLFCGSGGMSLGFTQSNFKIIFANDIEPSCIETYRLNHPEVDPADVVLGDIQDFAKTVTDYIGDKYVDIIIGGPPCQGFSNANKQRVIDDPRNRLYKEFVEVVSAVRPSFFVMENVIGMKEIAYQIVEDFKHIGYDVSYEILNAFDFGVPQQRKRIIFIGNKFNVDNQEIFNVISKKNMNTGKTTLFDAIGDLPVLEPLRFKNATKYESDKCGRVVSPNQSNHFSDYVRTINQDEECKVLYNHKSRYNNERDIEIFTRLHQGDKSTDSKIADIMPYQSRNNIFTDKYYKLVYSKPSKTITAHMKFDCNMYIHPTQSRGLTPREAARVQSYPDNYYFKGSFTKTYMQVGNSVPPLMAKQIASVIYEEVLKLSENELNDQMILNF